MPAIEEVMAIVRGMSQAERDELFDRFDEFDRQVWNQERAEATQAFHSAGLTDDDIDAAVRKMRHESRS
jgi:hypothetical protein